MDWRIIGTIGCALSLALVVVNAWIRYQEHTVGVRPFVKYPLAWLSLLLVPIGVIAGIIGVVIAESIKEEPVLILGLALVLSGLSGILAMGVCR
jgi:hypothetical protein